MLIERTLVPVRSHHAVASQCQSPSGSMATNPDGNQYFDPNAGRSLARPVPIYGDTFEHTGWDR